MNDEKYVYFEDTAEKALVARTGRHTTTPAPVKTKAEEEAPVYSVNYKELVPYNKLKTLPVTLQREWITRHIEHWNVGPTTIAKAMGIGEATLFALLAKIGVKQTKKHFDRNAKKLYLQVMAGDPRGKETVEAPPEIPQEAPKPTMKAKKHSFLLEGAFDAQAIANALQAVFENGQQVRIEIHIKEVEE